MHEIDFAANTPAQPCPILSKGDIISCFPPRKADTHKGSYGTLAIICGSYGMIGAAVMAAKGAMRCGVGLVHMVVDEACYPLIAPMLPQAVFTIIDYIPYGNGEQQNEQAAQTLDVVLRQASACIIGCGLGMQKSEWYLPLVAQHARCPVVIDADALRVLARMPALTRAHENTPFVLTPHPAEMGCLLQKTTAEVQSARLPIALTCARTYHAITVLKGSGTIIATPDGDAWQNPTGNPGIAKGGSGDVLAGMVGSLLAQGFAPAEAANCAVYLHGWAGDLAAAVLSQIAMLPTDLIETLPTCFAEIEAAAQPAPNGTSRAT